MPEDEDVSLVQLTGLGSQWFSVQSGSIGGAEVDDLEPAILPPQFSVPAGDGVLLEDDPVLLAPSNLDRRRAQVITTRECAGELDDETVDRFGHPLTIGERGRECQCEGRSDMIALALRVPLFGSNEAPLTASFLHGQCGAESSFRHFRRLDRGGVLEQAGLCLPLLFPWPVLSWP